MTTKQAEKTFATLLAEALRACGVTVKQLSP